MATFNVTTPEGWKIIRPERYKDFSIMHSKETPCVLGLAAPNEENGFDIVSIFDYGSVGNEFFVELKTQLDALVKNSLQVDEVNKYIEENTEGYAVTKADYLKPLFYKKGTIGEKKVFINIMEIKTNLSVSYSLQIFVKTETNVYCVTTASANVDVNKPFESIVKLNPHIQTVVDKIIPEL